MKKYMLLGNDSGLIESNFALIVINAHNFGDLGNLVVLKQDSETCKKLNDNMGYITIVDKYKNYLTDKLELVKIKEDDIECDYLFYLSQHEMDGTRKVPEVEVVSNCCNKPVIENTDLCSDCKEHSEIKYNNTKKDNFLFDKKIKDQINKISNVCFDTFEIIESNDEAGLITFLADNKIHTFKKTVEIIKEFLDAYGFTILHRASNYINVPDDDKYTELSDTVGKFFIIKNEEKYLKSKTNKPLHLYAHISDIGYIIGISGRNITRVKNEFNLKNQNWNVPYISIKNIEERTTNNSYSELKKEYYELLKYIFKENIKKHEL